jgi:biopolymer transport protein ExbD/biopolymer transport protein TolR
MLPSRRAVERANRRRTRFLSQPDFSPLLVIALLLVTIFLVRPVEYHGSGVDMVRLENAHNESGADKDDAPIITVSRDGRIYYGRTQAELPQLREQVRGALSTSFDKKIYLRPDARVRNGDVNLVIDELRTEGVTNVGILAEKMRTPNPQR